MDRHTYTNPLRPAKHVQLEIVEHLDIVYHPTIRRDKARELDLYVPVLPKGTVGAPPLIVFVHGGAWRT
jgi:acetyl esterase/lipase